MKSVKMVIKEDPNGSFKNISVEEDKSAKEEPIKEEE